MVYKQGFRLSFDNEKGSINAFFNGVFYFEVFHCSGIYETLMVVDNLVKDVLCIDSSNSLDKACLWHCHLGHVNKKRIAQIQKDGVLESFDLRDDDVCESCLLGNMTKSPFSGTCERVRVYWISYTPMCVGPLDQPQGM